MDISIHAPAWGATVSIDEKLHEFFISIHAPAWGATRSQGRVPPASYHFNPRSRVGSDFNRCQHQL